MTDESHEGPTNGRVAEVWQREYASACAREDGERARADALMSTVDRLTQAMKRVQALTLGDDRGNAREVHEIAIEALAAERGAAMKIWCVTEPGGVDTIVAASSIREAFTTWYGHRGTDVVWRIEQAWPRALAVLPLSMQQYVEQATRPEVLYCSLTRYGAERWGP